MSDSGIDWKRDQGQGMTREEVRELLSNSVPGKEQKTPITKNDSRYNRQKLSMDARAIGLEMNAKFLTRASPVDGHLWIYRDK